MADTYITAPVGANHSINYVVETSLGVVPTVTSANIFKLRNKGCTLGVTRDTLSPDELNGLRSETDLRLGVTKIAGNIPIALSFKEYDPFFESLLQAAWATNVLKVGKTYKSFAIERFFSDMATPYYDQFTGCVVDSFSLSVKPNEIVTGEFGFVGLTSALSATSLLSTGDPTASQTHLPYDSFTGYIKEGGSASAVVTGLTLNIKNDISPKYVLFQKNAAALPGGKCKVTGSASVMFTDTTMLNKFLNETATSIEFQIGNGTTETYTFSMGNVKYTSGQPDVNGEGEIELNMDFTGLYYTTDASPLKITRTAS